MTAFGFISLMKEIYGGKLPDLDKIQKKGLLAVKIAQHFALRVDFLDEEVCRHLSKLFTSAKPSPKYKGSELVYQYVSNDWFQNFIHFEEIPFATASIGQIHRATLKSGEKVVVKVIKNDFEESFKKDIKKLKRILKLSLFIYPKLKKVFNPLAILRHIEDYTLSELDLTNEIAGKSELDKIKKHYTPIYNLELMQFPYFFEKLSNKKLLVSKYIEGATFDTLLNNKQLPYSQLMELFNIHGLFIFAASMFHGDLHPGNVILSPDNQIFFIDTGALSRATSKMSAGLFGFFCSLSEFDYKKCAINLNKMADVKIEGKKYKEFEIKLLDLYKDFKGKTVNEVSLTKKMMDTIKLAVLSGMEFDQGMFPIIKSLMYLDGMVLKCNPNADLISDMKESINNFKRVINYENIN
jgi:ubiquinone biosynthesis protein